MNKKKLSDFLKKGASNPGKNYPSGTTGKLGNSNKPVTAVQKHKGKGY